MDEYCIQGSSHQEIERSRILDSFSELDTVFVESAVLEFGTFGPPEDIARVLRITQQICEQLLRRCNEMLLRVLEDVLLRKFGVEDRIVDVGIVAVESLLWHHCC